MGSDTGAIGTELFMNDSELTQFVTQLYGSSFYVYAGGVGGIGSWGHRKPCSGLDSNTGPNATVHD